MFSEIEKEYKKGLQERRFSRFYWPKASLVVVLALVGDFLIGINRWIIYGVMVAILLSLVFVFFVRDYHQAVKNLPKEERRGKSRKHRVQLYHRADDEIRINNLINDLYEHNLHTKSDIELAINYFERNRPVASKPNLLEWVLSIAVALSSIVILAYDETAGTIDTKKFLSVFGSTFAIALVILTPFVLAKFISARISASRTKLDLFLVEDLAFIYVNFDEFKDKLSPR